MMRVGIVIERIETWRGGAETSTLEFAHLLAARGVGVTIMTASRCPSPPDLRVVHLPVTLTPKPLRTARFINRATRRAMTERFDVVHAISPMPAADVYQPRGGLMRETIGRNVAMRISPLRRTMKRMVQALNIKHRTLMRLEEQALRPGGPMIAAVSGYVARQVREHYGLDGSRVRVVFNGVVVEPISSEERRLQREELRAEHNIGRNTVLLLCVAHNFRLKGVAPLLDALTRASAGLPRDAFRLLVVGRDNPAPMIARAANLGIDKLVTFVGPTQRIGAYYSAADVCVHPTYYDPCSRVVLEALARGLPCLTTRCNGASEIMMDGTHGFVLDSPNDIPKFADCLVRLSDSNLRKNMSAAAVELAPRVSMSRHVDEMLALYREVLALRRLGIH